MMTFYYSMKQMLRTPLRSILFFVLVGISALLLAVGGSLLYQSSGMEREFEKIYTTIATVEQKQEEVRTIPVWDETLQDYYYINHGVYGDRIPDEVLDFDGAPYLTEAKLRPHLGAYVEQMYQGIGRTTVITVEAEVTETRTASESIPLRITKVLEGAREEGEIVWFCDEHSEEAVTLEAGKTYIMQLREQGVVHGDLAAQNALDPFELEYGFTNGIVSSQFTPEGEQKPDPYLESGENKGVRYDEVTDGFYETERGKRWLNVAHTQEYENRTIPVTPVGETKLLLPFYRGEAVIEEGRDISGEEYETGADVCLIPRQLAVLLQKEVGDRVTLPLYYADYSYIGGNGMSAPTILNTDGEIYPVFDEREYEIVGIYTVSQSAEKDDSELGMYEVIIPWNTVPEEAWSENITGTGAGYMKSYNTSFQIPNGSIAEYMEGWKKQGIDVKNVLLWDIRRYYPAEYDTGLYALRCVKERFHVKLGEDEAGFIALHIVNAQMNLKQKTVHEITTVMQEIETIVRMTCKIRLDAESVYYHRFITHLKFFAERMFSGKTYEDQEVAALAEVIRAQYQEAYQCGRKIADFIGDKYQYTLCEEEILYLSIHIARIVSVSRKPRA